MADPALHEAISREQRRGARWVLGTRVAYAVVILGWILASGYWANRTSPATRATLPFLDSTVSMKPGPW